MTTCVNFNSISMLDRIKKAQSPDELMSLAVEGAKYKYASMSTRNRWERALYARDRALALED